jgi:hypothetical protein
MAGGRMALTVCVLCCHWWEAGAEPLCEHDTLAHGFEEQRAASMCAEIRDYQANGIPGHQATLFDAPWHGPIRMPA